MIAEGGVKAAKWCGGRKDGKIEGPILGGELIIIIIERDDRCDCLTYITLLRKKTGS
jgi:hypothetical protein